MIKADFDLAIVGAGVSGAYTLVTYLALLKRCPPKSPVRVVAFERTGEFWAGVPYGRRSGRNALIITALKEFLPEPERQTFVEWLSRHREELFGPADVAGRRLTEQWRRTNASAMAAGQWDDLFIPRWVFGVYLQEATTALLDEAVKAGLLEYELVAADVLDLERRDGRYYLTTSDGGPAGNRVLVADQVVLALGSPPNRPCHQDLPESAPGEICLVENLYEPGLVQNFARVAEFLERAAPRGRDQVLVVGSNASALEAIYSLVDQVDLADRIGRILVLSPNATFPHRIGPGSASPDFRSTHVEALVESRPFAASDILEALRRDVEAAEQRGINIADVFQAMSRAVIKAVNELDAPEQEKFVTDYGVRLGKLQRRAGPEYRDVVDHLLARQRLELLKGQFVRYIPESAGGPGCEYIDTATRSKKIRVAPLAAVINCGGFLDVNDWPSPLVQNLIRRGLCTPNASRRGFLLNEHFETSPGCYVMGPLVAGNLNRTLRIWHAESCTRIITLSRQLAPALMRPPEERA